MTAVTATGLLRRMTRVPEDPWNAQHWPGAVLGRRAISGSEPRKVSMVNEVKMDNIGHSFHFPNTNAACKEKHRASYLVLFNKTWQGRAESSKKNELVLASAKIYC